jgi:hypothetical protein
VCVEIASNNNNNKKKIGIKKMHEKKVHNKNVCIYNYISINIFSRSNGIQFLQNSVIVAVNIFYTN